MTETTQTSNDVKDKLNDINDEYKEAKTESTYRKRKKEKEEKEKELISSMAGTGSLLLSLIIPRLPNPIPLTEVEKMQFDIVFNQLVQKYFSYIEQFGEETAFALVLLMIIFPRIKKSNENNKDNIRSDGFRENNTGETINQ